MTKSNHLADLKKTLIMALQEQAMSTRSIEAGIYHTKLDSSYRLCNDAQDNTAPKSRIKRANMTSSTGIPRSRTG